MQVSWLQGTDGTQGSRTHHELLSDGCIAPIVRTESSGFGAMQASLNVPDQRFDVIVFPSLGTVWFPPEETLPICK